MKTALNQISNHINIPQYIIDALKIQINLIKSEFLIFPPPFDFQYYINLRMIFAIHDDILSCKLK